MRGRTSRAEREATVVKITQLKHFVVLADELHFLRAADKLGISRRKLDSSVEGIEAELGYELFDRDAPTTTLTPAGRAFVPEAYAQIKAAPEPEKAPAGGKAKASKGIGRTPAVKGQPKPYKKRQGR